MLFFAAVPVQGSTLLSFLHWYCFSKLGAYGLPFTVFITLTMDKYLTQPHFKKSQYYPFNKTGGGGDSHDSGFAKLYLGTAMLSGKC